MNKIHWYLGMMFGVKYRKWYYKTHNNKWLWGIYSFINGGEIKGMRKAKRNFKDYLKYLNLREVDE